VTSVTSRTTIHNAAFSTCQIPAFIRETEGSAVPVENEQFSTRVTTEKSASAVQFQFEVL
jgi:hypothetical protein